MLKKSLLISVRKNVVNIALLEDDKLIEIRREEDNSNKISVGDIFIGSVRKLLPSLNATFVDIGVFKDAFLHYSDLPSQFRTLDKYFNNVKKGDQKKCSIGTFKKEEDIDREGHISEVLSSTKQILVQVKKEPISTKGPRLSSEISIAGRYSILIPFSSKVSVSQKIKDDGEKERLKSILSKIKPKGFGIIVRTVSEGKDEDEISRDLKELEFKWKELYKNIKLKTKPGRVLSEIDRISSILRDLFDKDFVKIEVDDKSTYQEVRNYIKNIAPEKEKIVQLYNDDSIPLFEKHNVEKQLKYSFGKVVHMKKGVYLIIEHTEAMHVIDVNSGNKATNSDNPEENALAVNIMAAKEIARQVRLRDMGGIIVVDFIDLKKSENRKILYDKFSEFMSDDKAKHKILPPSKFGLIQLTRQRVRPEMKIDTREKDPERDGKIESTITIISRIENYISSIISTGKKDIKLHVHPFLASYLTKGLFSLRLKWSFRYRTNIKIIPRYGFSYLEYKIMNKRGEEYSKADFDEQTD